MTTIEILYSSSEGQARQIAIRVAGLLRQAGYSTRLDDVRNGSLDPHPAAVVLIASVHLGKHAAAASAFVRKNLAVLRQVPTAFMSVSLSASEIDRTRAQGYVNQFLEQTDWHPDLMATVAGAIRYTSYNFLKKLMIKKVAEENGLPTDTTRDYEFTNWDEVTAFVNALEGMVFAHAPPAA